MNKHFNRDGLSLLCFIIAAFVFVLGAFGVTPLSTTPNEWQDAGLLFFVLGALV